MRCFLNRETTRTQQMSIARFQAKFGQLSIETESGVIRGVKVMELGKLARFAGEDGKEKQVTITSEHIDALLSHAGNRSIPSHWSHDWFDKQTDPIHERIGALKTFRRDDGGSLIADLHLSPGKHRDTALWNAANDPENMMLSAVFGYSKFDAKCIPQSFQACDIVARGAATTALFSETQPESMEPKELAALLLAALADKEHGPTLKVALLAAMPKADEPDTKACDAMESEAGVTADDRKDTDTQMPALMRSCVRITRAAARQIKSIETSETALLEKFKVVAKSEATALLGKGGFIRQGADGDAGDATAKFNVAVKELTDRGVKQETALLTVINTKPELYNASQASLFKARATL